MPRSCLFLGRLAAACVIGYGAISVSIQHLIQNRCSGRAIMSTGSARSACKPDGETAHPRREGASRRHPRLSQLHLQALLDKQVDGIIFTATRSYLKQPPERLALPIPVIYAFTEGPPGSISFVPDDAQGARWRRNISKRPVARAFFMSPGRMTIWPRGCARRSMAILPRLLRTDVWRVVRGVGA